MGSLIERTLRERSQEGDLTIQVIRDRADPMLRHYLQPLMKLYQQLDYDMSAFHEGAFGHPGGSYQFNANDLYEELEKGDVLLLLHDLSGALGFAQLGFEQEGDHPYMTLRYLAVLPDCQGKGYGTHLVTKALAMADEEKCEYVTLTAYARNEAALKLYEKFGFHTTHVCMARKIK